MPRPHIVFADYRSRKMVTAVLNDFIYMSPSCYIYASGLIRPLAPSAPAYFGGCRGDCY